MKAMILCAGLGTRLRPITDEIAKPAVPLLNIPLLAYAMELAAPFDIDEFVVNTHHKPETVTFALKDQPFKNARVTFYHETPQVLGSGGGLWNARESLKGEDFLVINGDGTFVGFDPQEVFKILSVHTREKNLATLLAIEHPDVGKKYGGIWVDDQNNVLAVGKVRPEKATKGLHFVSLMVLSPDFLKMIPPGASDNLENIKNILAAGHRVGVHKVTQGTWLETGNPTDFLQATDFLLSALPNLSEKDSLTAVFSKWRPAILETGENPRPWVLVGKNVLLPRTLKVEGFTVIGDGVEIGENVEIKDSVIMPGTRIPPDSKLKNFLG